MKANSKNISQETPAVSRNNFLDKKATQVAFADLVGISQAGVSKHVGNILRPGETLDQWLKIYCEHLRQGAAGRSGDDQVNLTKARIAESEAKTALTRLAYHEKIKTLVLTEDAMRVLTEWAGHAKQTFENSFDELKHEIESKHGIKVDEDAVEAITKKALSIVGKYARVLAKSLSPESNDTDGI